MLILPVGETIRFVLTSRDVIHSFYVPDFLFKRDVIPGVRNRFDITIEEPGMYRGYCAEFCGLDHARMTFSVRALSPADYRDVGRAQAGELVTTTLERPEDEAAPEPRTAAPPASCAGSRRPTTSRSA